jgi:hypothetical protein
MTIEGLRIVVLAMVIDVMETAGRATANEALLSGDHVTVIEVREIGVVPRIVVQVRVDRLIAGRRLDEGLAADLGAVLAVLGASVARCRDLHRRVGRWRGRHITSRVLDRWMSGSRGWNTSSMRC